MNAAMNPLSSTTTNQQSTNINQNQMNAAMNPLSSTTIHQNSTNVTEPSLSNLCVQAMFNQESNQNHDSLLDFVNTQVAELIAGDPNAAPLPPSAEKPIHRNPHYKLYQKCYRFWCRQKKEFEEIRERQARRYWALVRPFQDLFVSAIQTNAYERGEIHCIKCGGIGDDGVHPMVACRKYIEACCGYDAAKIDVSARQTNTYSDDTRFSLSLQHPNHALVCVTCKEAKFECGNVCVFCSAEQISNEEFEAILFPGEQLFTDSLNAKPIYSNGTVHLDYYEGMESHLFCVRNKLVWIKDSLLAKDHPHLHCAYMRQHSRCNFDKHTAMGFLKVQGSVYDELMIKFADIKRKHKGCFDLLDFLETKLENAEIKVINKGEGGIIERDGKKYSEQCDVWASNDYDEKEEKVRDFVVFLQNNGQFVGGTAIRNLHRSPEQKLFHLEAAPLVHDVSSDETPTLLKDSILSAFHPKALSPNWSIEKEKEWRHDYYGKNKKARRGDDKPIATINKVHWADPNFEPVQSAYDIKLNPHQQESKENDVSNEQSDSVGKRKQNKKVDRVKLFIGFNHVYNMTLSKMMGKKMGVYLSGIRNNQYLLQTLSCVDLILRKASSLLVDYRFEHEIMDGDTDAQINEFGTLISKTVQRIQIQIVGYEERHGIAAHHDLWTAFVMSFLIASFLTVYMHFGSRDDRTFDGSPVMEWALLFRAGDGLVIDKDCLLDTFFKHKISHHEVTKRRISYQVRLIAYNYIKKINATYMFRDRLKNIVNKSKN